METFHWRDRNKQTQIRSTGSNSTRCTTGPVSCAARTGSGHRCWVDGPRREDPLARHHRSPIAGIPPLVLRCEKSTMTCSVRNNRTDFRASARRPPTDCIAPSPLPSEHRNYQRCTFRATASRRRLAACLLI